MDFLLTNLADELLVQDITEPSAVLGSLSDDDLQAAYDNVVEQFALELLIGAHRDSSWSNGNLVMTVPFICCKPPSMLRNQKSSDVATLNQTKRICHPTFSVSSACPYSQAPDRQ